MKKLFALLFTLVAVSAQADGPTPAPLSAKLTEFKMDASTKREVLEGNVVVFQTNIAVNLTIDDKKFCVTTPCPQTIELEFSAPRTGDSTSCGSKIYVAEYDARPADGYLTRIIVQDNSTRRCRDLRPQTEVKIERSYYDRINGGMVTLFHEASSNETLE